MPSKKITREDFVSEIRKLKIETQLKLKELFSVNDEKTKNLRTLFFANPIISSYLSRDAGEVKFLQSRPELIDVKDKKNKEEKNNSDYYELRIYKLNPELALYRDEIQSDRFYRSGTKNSASLFFEMRNSRINTHDIFMQENSDVANIRHLLNWFECRDKLKLKPWALKELEPINQVRFILSPNWQDAHAMSMVHILDHKNRHILATVFINSRVKEENTTHVRARFNQNSFYNYPINNVTLERIKKEYKTAEQTEKVFINSEQRMGVRLNGSIDLSEAYNELITNPTIDFIYDIENRSLGNQLLIKRQIPFIDASHNLQLEDEDNNCVLYSANFIEAISNMLKDKTIADSIYELAQKIDQGDQQAKANLRLIFCENLKSYLPCYYDSTGDIKPSDKIKEYHLQQRWDLGSEKLRFDIALSK